MLLDISLVDVISSALTNPGVGVVMLLVTDENSALLAVIVDALIVFAPLILPYKPKDTLLIIISPVDVSNFLPYTL